MRQRKQDAADILAQKILSAIREYKATKDAPERQRQARLIASELDDLDDGLFHCPHVDRCDNREKCRTATVLGRPERANKEAS